MAVITAALLSLIITVNSQIVSLVGGLHAGVIVSGGGILLLFKQQCTKARKDLG